MTAHGLSANSAREKPLIAPAGRSAVPGKPVRRAESPIWNGLAWGAQARLRVGASNDPAEVEADRVADQVLRMPAPRVQRQCAACETGSAGGDATPEDELPTIRRRAQRAGEAAQAPDDLTARLGAGSPLDTASRAFFEPRFGHDLGEVRVHSGPQADAAAARVDALAFTLGRDVVFAAGRHEPQSASGRRLLAHELTHVVQQGAAVRRLPRDPQAPDVPTAGPDASGGPATVVRRSAVSSGAVSAGSEPGGGSVRGTAPRSAPRASPVPSPQTCPPPARMACAAADTSPGAVTNTLNFAQDSAALTGVQRAEIDAAAAAWRAAGGGVAVRVDGYASAEGDCAYNWDLSCRRAQAVAAELEAPRDGSVGVPAGDVDRVAHGESDEAGRALAPNRKATISIPLPLPVQEPDPPAVEHCGPDSTAWLVDQMNRNANHPAIRTARETTWPRYVPFFNLGWTYGFLSDFRDLVRAGAVWDFKSNQDQWRAGAGKPCPSLPCDRTVELCGRCFNYDVPGNIHYGWIGRMAGLRPWFLHNRADAAQAGGVDDPHDAVAIDIGIAMADDGASLCSELAGRGDSLNLEHTDGCEHCDAA